jgi:predicted RNase H-like HicB family nuclease
MALYAAVLEGEGDVWSIRVPDLKGCHGGGSTPEEAMADTISAMREWAATVLADCCAIPPPRTVQEVMSDPEVEFDPAAGESIVMLPLLVELGRQVRANLSLDAGILEAIDAEANRRGLTRSAFLAKAALDLIERGA